MMKLTGSAVKLGDNINTDIMISGRYTKTLDLKEMSRHVFEDLDETLASRLKGKIIAAGENFGLGSSREQAPVAIKEAGVVAIVAKSFARIFFRNAVNIGLPVLTADTARIAEGDQLEIALEEGRLLNLTTHQALPLEPLPKIMLDILKDGGLVNHLKNKPGQ